MATIGFCQLQKLSKVNILNTFLKIIFIYCLVRIVLLLELDGLIHSCKAWQPWKESEIFFVFFFIAVRGAVHMRARFVSSRLKKILMQVCHLFPVLPDFLTVGHLYRVYIV